jgi:hypothetical protein
MTVTIVDEARPVIGGVDTHADTHVVAALDGIGGLLGVPEFAATPAGYARLLGWLQGFGAVGLAGIEGTGSYGAGLARHIAAAGIRVVEAGSLCRSEIHIDRAPGNWALVALLAVAAAGALIGRWVILQAPDAAQLTTPDKKAALQLWAALIEILSGFGLAAGAVMTLWSWQLVKIFQPRVPRMSAFRWAVATVLVLLIVFWLEAKFPAAMAAGTPVHLFHRQLVGITIAAGVIAIPGLVGFLAARSLAWNDSQWDEEPRCQILMVVRLRRHLRRLLGAFGLMLTLIVVTTAARRQLVLAVYPKATYSQEYVLLYGLVFAAVLALFHVSATMAIDGRCERLLAEYAPVPDPKAEDISTPLARRQDLAAFLGMGASWQKSFQDGVIIFAPLFTALIGTALSK